MFSLDVRESYYMSAQHIRSALFTAGPLLIFIVMEEKNKISPIITGVTGMVGEGVLHECLLHPDVEKILVIGRKPCGITDPKIKEIIHQDFFDLSPIQQELEGYNACFFCLGVSSLAVNKAMYYKLTYTLTMHMGEILSRLNPGMTFCYVSGSGTDSTEKGRLAWARVKGKTENDLMKLPFKNVYAFRPGFIKPTPNLKNTHKFYAYINWLFPVGRALFPRTFCTMKELGTAMIQAAQTGFRKNILEGNDIIELGNRDD